jgi:hypothetical protein
LRYGRRVDVAGDDQCSTMEDFEDEVAFTSVCFIDQSRTAFVLVLI